MGDVVIHFWLGHLPFPVWDPLTSLRYPSKVFHEVKGVFTKLKLVDDRPTDRQTDRQTDIATYRSAIADKNRDKV